jgi:hypothetical protein
VRLHPGWFEGSIPAWLESNPGPVAFIHVDCDLYRSTQTIFMLLAERIVPGTIILFDEYFNYPNWEQHEFRAFQEFVPTTLSSTATLDFRANRWPCASKRSEGPVRDRANPSLLLSKIGLGLSVSRLRVFGQTRGTKLASLP